MNSIWAVAINTIRQTLRLKIAAIFILLLIVILPIMGFVFVGDGTIKGRLQTFLSYGLSLTGFLLSLLTIIASVYTVTSDIVQKQIFTVITKPIKRYQFLMGKLLGIILLNTVLLVIFSGIIYGITLNMPKYSNASKDEIDKLQQDFYTARTSLALPEIDVVKDVNETYTKMSKNGQLPENMAKREVMHILKKQAEYAKRAAAPGYEVVWEFKDVKPFEPNQNIYIRYKYEVSVNPPDLQVSGKWLVGDIRQYGKMVVTPIYAVERKDLIRTAYEFEVPADAVAQDGYFAVVFFNDPAVNNTVVVFPPETGMAVLYKADTFAVNFVSAVALIFIRLVFLACLGIFSSSFLSFPVAIFLCFVIFFTATISGFVLESFDYIGEVWGGIYAFTVRPLVNLLPQFDKMNPSEYLVAAKLISWQFLLRIFLVTIFIKALILLLLGLWAFHRREIAKITV
jgi:hypothetical protein